MQEFIDAPEKKRTNDTYAERYRYVRAFFKFAKKDVIEGLKDKVKLTQTPEFAELRETDEFKLVMSLEPRVL